MILFEIYSNLKRLELGKNWDAGLGNREFNSKQHEWENKKDSFTE